ncbi:MAG: hypothetical protein AAF585_11535 [Verrucomicrobiota bacterium]
MTNLSRNLPLSSSSAKVMAVNVRNDQIEQSVLDTVHAYGPISAPAIGALDVASDDRTVASALNSLVERGDVAVIFPGGQPAFVDPQQLQKS